MKFYLKRSKEDLASIILDVNYYNARARITTGYLIKASNWDEIRQKVTKGENNYILINNYLSKLKGKVDVLLNDYKINKINITSSNLKEIIKEIVNPNVLKRLDKKGESNLFEDYFRDWIESRKQSGQISKARIQKYHAVLNHFIEFKSTNKIELTREEFNNSIIEKFTSYLINEKKLANSTISSIIKVIKVFINKVKSEKNEFLNLDIKNYKPTKESTSNSVALNEEEIANLITVNLQTSIHQKVRDLFLLQIYTFLRISDLKRISPESINIEEQTLIINQIKTGEKVIIPLTDFCMDILKKYNYTIPKISDQKYNYYIKDICKLAGIDNLIEVVRYSGSNRIEEKCAKYELMTSHSARRTGITLLIKRGVAPNVIMQVSGHRKIETLMKYVRITQNEAVEIIRKVWR